ncbi:AcrR family transcriptional regulator [Streptomyces aurantiacus]|uniref:TetR/AcrR family transcriptional regulator n=1 Tax=Streptomyces aurantiacus TaxID=47760 RepID=UPI0027902B67|nr:TetR/AcrR family transcriptional regulator [Streptomyces aurantiacus]MDQ0772329.1 AcrR family transcriptional regulator [Streptomyces aurantiacus]
MPNSTRRARERASTHDRIIEAALRVLESEGAAALTVRRIAADVEYTAPVVYQHFANKDALVLRLVGHGHDLLLAELRRVVEEPDIDRRMLRVASAYVRFAGEHPHLYEAMNGTVVDADERRRAAEPAIDVLKELLATWSDAHGVELADHDEACEIVWGTLYGMASLGRLGTVGTERAQRLAEQALGAILRGWQTEG